MPSVTGLWRGADWFERYCFDMYGIRFTDHPDMRRLLMYDEFVGYPLRKDYPLKGRQPLVEERDVHDIVRGPGPATRLAPVDRLRGDTVTDHRGLGGSTPRRRRELRRRGAAALDQEFRLPPGRERARRADAGQAHDREPRPLTPRCTA